MVRSFSALLGPTLSTRSSLKLSPSLQRMILLLPTASLRHQDPSMPSVSDLLGKSFADQRSIPDAVFSHLYQTEVTDLHLRGQTDWEQAREVCTRLEDYWLLYTD